MAPRLVLFFHTIMIVLLSSTAVLTATSTGFSLQLTYPQPPTNLSDHQRLLGLSLYRTRYLQSQATASLLPRPPISLVDDDPFVNVAFGTPDRQEQKLLLDTGSALTWVRCLFPGGFFQPDAPHFVPSRSRTYRSIPSEDPRCNHRLFSGQNSLCQFQIKYHDKTTAEGIVSTENFTAESSGGRGIFYRNDYIFGCSSTKDVGLPSVSSGVLGLNRDAIALHRQLSQSAFAHCFPVNPNARTYLRLGADTSTRYGTNPLSSTPFIDNPTNQNAYFLNVVDIAVNGRRLLLPSSLFAPSKDRGCVIDSGCTYTILYRAVYNRVEVALVNHFKRQGLERLPGSELHGLFGLCYKTVTGRRVEMPSMDFLFANRVTFHIPPENVFTVLSSQAMFCLAMMRSDDYTIIGTFQQRNMRIIYNLAMGSQGSLQFAPEDCSRDPAI